MPCPLPTPCEGMYGPYVLLPWSLPDRFCIDSYSFRAQTAIQLETAPSNRDHGPAEGAVAVPGP